MSYELVLLDLDDTLFDYDKTEDHALRKLFESISVEYSDVYGFEYSKINSSLWEKYEKGEVDKSELRVQRFTQLFESIDIKKENDEIIYLSNKYLDYLSSQVFYEPYAKSTLEYLKQRYKVLFFTNGIHSVQLKRLENAGILEDVHELISSDIAGCSKPNKKIFEFALDSAGIKNKSKVIVIGDGLRSDIKGAIDFGVKSIWYNKHGKNVDDSLYDIEIRSLQEIKNLI